MLKKKKSLDAILSGFTKTINELNTLIDTNNATVQGNKNLITSLEDENKVLDDESVKANKVLTNISKLTSTD